MSQVELRPVPGRWCPPGLLLFVVWTLTLVRPTLSNGDAVVYLQQVLEADLSIRTLHLGYLAWLRGWLEGLRVVLPESLPRVLASAFPPAGPDAAVALVANLGTWGWSLAAVVGLMRLERQLFPGRPGGGSPLWWASSLVIFPALTTSEIYPMQWALLLWMGVAWGAARSVTAGALLGLAILVSPGSVTALPLLGLGSQMHPRGHRRAWLELAAVCALVAGPPILANAPDYFYGPRGILLAPEGMSVGEALRFRAGGLPAALGLGGLLLVTGLRSSLVAETRAARRLPGVLAVHTGLVLVLVDRYRDVPAYGVAAALGALLMAEGASTLHRRGRDAGKKHLAALAIGILLALQLLQADQSTRALRKKEALLVRDCLSERTSPEGGPEPGFSRARLCEWYRQGRRVEAP